MKILAQIMSRKPQGNLVSKKEKNGEDWVMNKNLLDNCYEIVVGGGNGTFSVICNEKPCRINGNYIQTSW